MAKEWSRREQFQATRPFIKKQFDAALKQGNRVVGTRWILNRNADGSIKARLVVQGCQERDNNVRSDSPTGRALAFWLALAFGGQQGWSFRGYDAKSALLPSEGLDRVLMLWIPGAEPLPGTVPWQIYQALGSIYDMI